MPVLTSDCLVLECADAAALTEALAALPPRVVVWRVSDTIVGLDPEWYDDIVAALRRAGLTPREATA